MYILIGYVILGIVMKTSIPCWKALGCQHSSDIQLQHPTTPSLPLQLLYFRVFWRLKFSESSIGIREGDAAKENSIAKHWERESSWSESNTYITEYSSILTPPHNTHMEQRFPIRQSALHSSCSSVEFCTNLESKRWMEVTVAQLQNEWQVELANGLGFSVPFTASWNAPDTSCK